MVSTHLSGARAFESVILVLALGNLITAAPTRFADLAAGPLDVYVPALDPKIFVRRSSAFFPDYITD